MDAGVKRDIATKLLEAHSMLHDAVDGAFVLGSNELEASMCIEDALDALGVKTKARAQREEVAS
jgi:hypothetical protein